MLRDPEQWWRSLKSPSCQERLHRKLSAKLFAQTQHEMLSMYQEKSCLNFTNGNLVSLKQFMDIDIGYTPSFVVVIVVVIAGACCHSQNVRQSVQTLLTCIKRENLDVLELNMEEWKSIMNANFPLGILFQTLNPLSISGFNKFQSHSAPPEFYPQNKLKRCATSYCALFALSCQPVNHCLWILLSNNIKWYQYSNFIM